MLLQLKRTSAAAPASALNMTSRIALLLWNAVAKETLSKRQRLRNPSEAGDRHTVLLEKVGKRSLPLSMPSRFESRHSGRCGTAKAGWPTVLLAFC